MKTTTPRGGGKKPDLHRPKQRAHSLYNKGLEMRGVAEHYLLNHACSKDYCQALQRVARSMEQGGLADPSALTPDSFNRWVRSLNQGPTTVGNYRRMGLTLWRHAARQSLAPHITDGIVKVKPSRTPPVAWSMDELNTLLAHCRGLEGSFRSSGCPKALFFTAWVLAGYELGIRKGDLHNLRCDQVRGNRIYIIQNKTGIPIGKIVTEECADLLGKLCKLGDGKTVFKWALARKWLFLNFKKVVHDAGLHGSTKFLRRSGATHCEIAQPGSAGKFLGHLSPGLAQRYYLDPSLLATTQPRPPALTGLKVFSRNQVSG